MRTRNMISMKELIKALTESAENAARRVGFSLKYEGKIPNQVEYPQRRKKLKRNGKIVTVTSKKTDFDVIVWFNGEQQARQTYLK